MFWLSAKVVICNMDSKSKKKEKKKVKQGPLYMFPSDASKYTAHDTC